MIDPKWATVAGLVCDILGAAILAYGLVVSKEKAAKLGASYWGGGTIQDNLKSPPVRDRLMQSRNAIIGASFLIGGFLLQIYGAWPR